VVEKSATTMTNTPRHSMPYLTLAIVGILLLAAIFISLGVFVHLPVAKSTTPPNRSHNPYGAPGYGFGGYLIHTPTTEVGAQWRVPVLSSHSKDGDASTWIAVQNVDGQFIQIGTTENVLAGIAMYAIFWSDVTEHFHPQQLIEVNANDLIKFKMVQKRDGWRLSFDDVTTNDFESVPVAYARGADFDAPQWFQEDPTIGGLSSHAAYPTISPTTFRDLTVNGAMPSVPEYDAQVLSTQNGVHLVPTTFKHDSFGFANAAGAARQYLGDVFAYNAAIYPFQVDLFYNRAVSAHDLDHIRSTLVTLEQDLQTQSWPKNLESAVKGDAKLVADYENEFDNLPSAPVRVSTQTLAHYQAADARDSHYADTLRHELGLPPIK
jgi:hypothetical protein